MTDKQRKLTDDDYIQIIKIHRKDSFGPDSKELTRDRVEAMDRYNGKPYGNEVTGRSSVVTRDLSETINWAMPAMIRPFVMSGNIAEFDPVGPEDIELAEQEADYINHVIMKDNQGFMLIHDTLKDAMLLKNCYAKHYWEEKDKVRERTYSDISLEELALVLHELAADGKDYELLSHDVREGTDGVEKYDVKIKVSWKEGRVRVFAVPPEELRVSHKCRGSLQDSIFTEHLPIMTRSDLIEMGMPKDFVMSLSPKGVGKNDSETQSRNTVSDEDQVTPAVEIDMSMQEVDYAETYMKVDGDGDGIAELRKIISADDKIPDGDDWNEVVESVCFTGGVVKRMPHRHIGESINDDIQDLAEIHTVLMRQALDNIYRTNDNEYIINSRADPNEFMQTSPGGAKTLSGNEPVEGHVMPLITTPILDKIIPAIDHITKIKEHRTGVTDASTGMDPDVLKESTKGAFLENLSRAVQVIEMMTRMYAETFVKELVLRVHEIIIKYQDKERVVRLRGRFVPIKPDEWEERTDLTVKVGLGTGSTEERMQKLMLLRGIQKEITEQGLAGPEQAYNMFIDMARALGEESPESYVIDPNSDEFKEHRMYMIGLAKDAEKRGNEDNPLVAAEKVKAQAKLQSEQMTTQAKIITTQLQEQHKASLAQLEALLEQQRHSNELLSKETIAAATLEVKALIEGLKIDLGKKGMGAGLQDGGN